jgi:hypothetical protein
VFRLFAVKIRSPLAHVREQIFVGGLVLIDRQEQCDVKSVFVHQTHPPHNQLARSKGLLSDNVKLVGKQTVKDKSRIARKNRLVKQFVVIWQDNCVLFALEGFLRQAQDGLSDPGLAQGKKTTPWPISPDQGALSTVVVSHASFLRTNLHSFRTSGR